MRVRVELFGIPRRRAGAAQVDIELPAASAEIAVVLRRLVDLYPALADDCLSFTPQEDSRDSDDDSPARRATSSSTRCQLAEHCLLQVRDVFTRDATGSVSDGERIMLLSADAGG